MSNVKFLSYGALALALFFAQQPASSTDMSGINGPDADQAARALNTPTVQQALTEGFQGPAVEHLYKVQVARFDPDIKLTVKGSSSMITHDTLEYYTKGGQKLFEILLQKTPGAVSYPDADQAARALDAPAVQKALTEGLQGPALEHLYKVQVAHFAPGIKLTVKVDTSMMTHDTVEYYIKDDQKLYEISLQKTHK